MTEKSGVVLAVETTAAYLGLGFYAMDAAGRCRRLADSYLRQPKHAELFFPELERLLKKARLKREDISLIVADVGPGSFTGVRVGVAAARALAHGLGLPCAGVSSLEALAWRAARAGAGGRIVACLPALETEAYYSTYDRKSDASASGFSLKTLLDPRWKDLKTFSSELRRSAKARPVVATVDEENARALRGKVDETGNWVFLEGPADPATLAEIGWRRFLKGPAAAFHYSRVTPLYLQPSWAERERKRPAAAK